MRTVDVCGEVKPRSRAWVNGKTIWFVLYRRSKYPIGGHKEGTWIPVTRTHPKKAWAAKLVKKIMAGYAARALINGADTDGTDARDNRPREVVA